MIEGISLGSDDYPVKPFLPLELVARVGAIFRRIEMARGGAGLSQSEVRAQASAFLALPKDGNYAANREVYVAVLGSETQVSFPRDQLDSARKKQNTLSPAVCAMLTALCV